MFKHFLAIITLSNFCCALSLYEPNDNIVELTDSSFKTIVEHDTSSFWLIEFYSPFCGNCIQFAPAYKEVAKSLKGFLKIGAVNADEYRYLDAFLATISVTSHMNYVPLYYQKTDDVIELTPENFDKMVLKDKSIWLVQFYSPGCIYCKILKPEYIKAAKILKGHVKLGAINAYENKTLANKYNIKGYPTLRYFVGTKRIQFNYIGKRTADDIVESGMNLVNFQRKN